MITTYEITESGAYINVKTSHQGCVVRVYTDDYRAMSDIYTTAKFADIWCTETSSVRYRYMFDSGLHPEDPKHGDANVDINEGPHRAAYAAYLEKVEAARQRKIEDERAAAEAQLLHRPEKGKRMVVVRGRKVKPGTVGVVFWIRDGRVGLDVTGERDTKGYVKDPVWVNGDYLQAV